MSDTSLSDLAELRSTCPVAAGLDIFGDKWTLLIVRDIILHGHHRYSDFVAMTEGIPTNILADRLKRLEAHDIVEKVLYQNHPPRYEYHLTGKGQGLEPIVRAMINWGLKHVPGTGKHRRSRLTAAAGSGSVSNGSA